MNLTYIIATGLISLAAGYGISRAVSNSSTVRLLNEKNAIEGEFSAYRQKVEALTSAAPEQHAKLIEVADFLATIANLTK
jgi:hypothetical protein